MIFAYFRGTGGKRGKREARVACVGRFAKKSHGRTSPRTQLALRARLALASPSPPVPLKYAKITPVLQATKKSNVPGFARGGGDGRFWNWPVHYVQDFNSIYLLSFSTVLFLSLKRSNLIPFPFCYSCESDSRIYVNEYSLNPRSLTLLICVAHWPVDL